MSLKIHTDIIEKLIYFHKIQKIPNIIFHGNSGYGKKTILNKFINIIYNNDKERIRNFVMYVNCSHGKGIKFIREEMKYFAKTHINNEGGNIFKSIILLNADNLTIDAQSALRRCLELFTHSTRFFIIVEDKYKLLRPILSRFCEIYIPKPVISGAYVNLYKYNLNQTFKLNSIKNKRNEALIKELRQIKDNVRHDEIIMLSNKLYENGFSALDIITALENKDMFDFLLHIKRYELLFFFNKLRTKIRCETMLIMFMLHFIYIDKEYSVKNINTF
jgi:DNA polymerase III delta prime subunit